MKTQILAVSGLMHSGKTSVVSMIQELLEEKNYWNRQRSNQQTYQPKLIKFAQPLYDMQEYIYKRAGIELKNKDRGLLQYLGTQWGRSIDENLWVDLWRQEVRSHLFKSANHTTQIVLCDDLRFDNEAKQILDLGGKIIWVEADESTRRERSPSTFSGTNHISESGISPEYISLTIYNNKTLGDLKSNVKYLLEEVL